MKETNENQCYEFKYTGSLNGAPAIYVHYGVNNWEGISEVKMRKLKSCYKAEITVPATSIINFCFTDGLGNWDNNCGNDYCYSPKHGESYSEIAISLKAKK